MGRISDSTDDTGGAPEPAAELAKSCREIKYVLWLYLASAPPAMLYWSSASFADHVAANALGLIAAVAALTAHLVIVTSCLQAILTINWPIWIAFFGQLIVMVLFVALLVPVVNALTASIIYFVAARQLRNRGYSWGLLGPLERDVVSQELVSE